MAGRKKIIEKPRKVKPEAPPITKMGMAGRDQQKQSRLKINQLNKQRSKRMEDWVAAYFRAYGFDASRVPLSGAAKGWKGDVFVNFTNNAGKLVIECKLSSNVGISGYPRIIIQTEWFTKLQDEVDQAMSSKFGVLVAYFHDHNDRFVFIRQQDLERLITVYNVPDKPVIEAIIGDQTARDYRYNGKGLKTRTFTMQQDQLHNDYHTICGVKYLKAWLPNDLYVIMPLVHFRELVATL